MTQMPAVGIEGNAIQTDGTTPVATEEVLQMDHPNVTILGHGVQ